MKHDFSAVFEEKGQGRNLPTSIREELDRRSEAGWELVSTQMFSDIAGSGFYFFWKKPW